MHGFLTADFLGRTQDTKSPAYIVVKILLSLFDQKIPRFAFILDDSSVRHHPPQVQRDLVRDAPE